MSKIVPPIHGADHCPGGPDPIPGDCIASRSDRMVEYMWGGPKFAMSNAPPGKTLINWSWVKDTANSAWGGYIETNPGVLPGSPIFFGCPLGPRWSSWELQIAHGMGADYGQLALEVGTVPFYRGALGMDIDASGGTEEGSDIPNPDWFHAIDWYKITASNNVVDCYHPTDVYDRVSRFGPNHFRIVGKYGTLLTSNGTDETDELPLGPTGQNMNGGDGVFWWFKIWVNDSIGPSTGNRARIHAIRLVRVVEVDSYAA